MGQVRTEPATDDVIDLRDHVVEEAVRRDDAAALAARLAERRDEARERHRLAQVVGLAVLIVLNALDLVSTDAFLERGLNEGNPLSSFLIIEGWIGWVKAAILLALGIRILRGRPRLATTCAVWFVAGLYATIVAVNFIALASLT